MKRKIVFFALVLSLCALPFTFADSKTSPEKLGKHLKRHLGEQVKFTDEILYIYKTQPYKKKNNSGYIKFETRHVRCLIRQSAAKQLKLIKDQLKSMPPKVLTFTGTVTKKDEFQYFVEVYQVEYPKYVK